MGAEIKPEQTYRPGVLPITRDAQTGQWQLVMPKILDVFGSAMPSAAGSRMAPVAVRAGEGVLGSPIPKPVSAGGLSGTGLSGAGREAELLAAKRENIYNPPGKEPRPFEADYPRGVADEPGAPLARDIEGRPLVAKYVVGRRVVGGADQALPATELNALTESLTGSGAQVVAPSQIRGAVGAVEVTPAGDPKYLFLSNKLHPDDVPLVHAHELGHVIDRIARNIPTAGLNDELKAVYNTLNNPNRTRDGLDAASWGKPWTPRAAGYTSEQAPREMIVEAIRAYMVNPNCLKTVAPNVAARIREYVNANPRLNRVIQFNAGAGPLGPLAGFGDTGQGRP